MARSTLKPFDKTTETQMQNFFGSLSEKDQRHYAAIQSRQLGYGGIVFVAQLLGCSTRTINRGLNELESLPDDSAAGRVRRPGAGRKKSSSRI